MTDREQHRKQTALAQIEAARESLARIANIISVATDFR